MHIHPVIHCNVDINPQDDKKFLENIGQIGVDLDSAAKQQNYIAISFQSRIAPLKDIKEKHTAWTDALKILSTKIEKCRLFIEQQNEQLPFLKSNETIIKGWPILTDLEQKCYRIKEKNKNLTALLNSTEYRDALQFYKKIIEECETKSNIPGHLKDLVQTAENKIAAQKKSIENFSNQSLIKAIVSLHQETFRFLLYAVGTTAALDSTKTKLEGLLQLRPLEVRMDDLEIVPQEIPDPVEEYLDSFETVKLQDDRHFKMKIHFPDLRYPSIYSTIEQMQDIGKGLQQIEIDLENDIKEATQGIFPRQKRDQKNTKVAFYKESLEELKKYLREEEEALYKIIFNNEVHSGLHYAASLFVWADEIQNLIDFFEKISQDSWKKVATIQLSLFDTLKQPIPTADSPIHESSEAVIALFKTICLFTSIPSDEIEKDPFLQQYKKTILSRTVASLARIGKMLLPLSSRETELENAAIQIIEFNTLSNSSTDFVINNGIKSLIGKKLIQLFYFTTNKFDLSLDLFLTALTTQKIYKSHYKQIQQVEDQRSQPCIYSKNTEAGVGVKALGRGEEFNFTQFINHYSKNTELNEDKKILSMFIEIHQILQFLSTSKSKKTKKEYFFFLYAKCQQKIFEARNTQKKSLSISRLNSFIENTKNIFSEIKRKNEYFDYYDDLQSITIPKSTEEILSLQLIEPVIYKLLIQALWAIDSDERTKTRAILDELVNNSRCNYLSDNTKYLFKILALDSFDCLQQNDKVSNTTKTYLPHLLAQFIQDPNPCPEHNLQEIEFTLYSLFCRKETTDIAMNPVLKRALESSRKGLFFDDWKELMTSSYVPFATDPKNMLAKTTCKKNITLFQETHPSDLYNNLYYAKILGNILTDLES